MNKIRSEKSFNEKLYLFLLFMILIRWKNEIWHHSEMTIEQVYVNTITKTKYKDQKHERNIEYAL